MARVHTCSKCKKGFHSKSYLSKHMIIHSIISPYSCTICLKRFNWKQSLVNHTAVVHAPESPFKCQYCSKTLSGSKHLNIHLRTHTGQGLSDCSKCNKKFATAATLKKHMIKHAGISDHMCPFCSYVAQSQSDLESHLTSHTGEKPFQCTLCSRSFGRKDHLKSHNVRVHNVEGRRHKCQFCDYKAKEKGGLTQHVRIHSIHRQFTCRFCDRGFNRFPSLALHIRSHTKETPFQCHSCQLSFASSRKCKQHVQEVHEGVRFKCDVCGKDCRTREGHKVHAASHTTPRSCEFCRSQRSVPRVCDLNFHRRIHIGRNVWACGPCAVSYKFKFQLLDHQQSARCRKKRKSEILTRHSQIILQRVIN